MSLNFKVEIKIIINTSVISLHWMPSTIEGLTVLINIKSLREFTLWVPLFPIKIGIYSGPTILNQYDFL